MLWVLKRTVLMRGSFEHPVHMFILVDKKIIAILRTLFLLNWSYVASVGEDCFISLLCAEMPDEIPHSVCQSIEFRIEMLNDEYITIHLHCVGMICYSLHMKISNSIYFYDPNSTGTVNTYHLCLNKHLTYMTLCIIR